VANTAAAGAAKTIPAPPIAAAVATNGRTGLRDCAEPVPRELRLDIEKPPSFSALSQHSAT
jgi:hypothetical protein